MKDPIYRICEAADWERTQTEGLLPLSTLDESDGFVHLSTASQVGQTLLRYFAGRGDLLLLTIACERLVSGVLRFEPPLYGGHRHAELFPHLHGRVPLDAIVAVDELPLGDDGLHLLPPALLEVRERERERELAGARLLELWLVWDETRQVALLEYPRPTRIEDEAGILALEALLEGRLDVLTRERGKVPLVVGVDNLWIAPKLVGRYLELVDKLALRAFHAVARWSSDEGTRAFFTRTNSARALPSDVFASREEAVAFVLGQGDDSGILGE